MKLSFTVFLLFLATLSFGQEKKSTFHYRDDPKPNIKIDPLPVFSGEIDSYIKENIHYPEEAYEHKIDGRVIVSYAVKADGYVGRVKVLEGIGYGCDKEAKRLVENMPQWKPGEQNGKKVNTYYTLRVDFEYPEDSLILLQDRKPEFPGNIGKFIRNNIHHTEYAEIYDAQGVVTFEFVIDKMGYVTNIKLINRAGYGLDEATYWMLKRMPRWKPAIIDGKKVAYLQRVSVDFR